MLIPIARPTFGPEEEEAVLAVMRSGQFAQGEQVRRFESAFAAATGASFAVATSNGTTALFLALLAHGIGPGDEVITSPLTFIATANAIAQTGAKPVFGDVDDSLNLDPEAAAQLIRPQTRAIVPVHLHGNPCDIRKFSELGARHNVAVIQDACQAVGAFVHEQPLGSYGTAVYSFYATKNLTTGEGGMVTSNNLAVAECCAQLRHQAYSDKPYVHDRIGYNFRLTELAAAIGLAQLEKLPCITERRRAIAAYYDETIPHDRFPRPSVDRSACHVFHQYTLRLGPENSHADDQVAAPARDAVRKALERGGVGTGVYYPVPVHRQPAYQALSGTSCPNAERASADMFSIPVHPSLADAEVEYVADQLRRL
jgi:perosamine synthetase